MNFKIGKISIGDVVRFVRDSVLSGLKIYLEPTYRQAGAPLILNGSNQEKMDTLSKYFHSTRNNIVVTSIIFLLQRFANINIVGKIPLLNIAIPQKEASLKIISVLSFYFLIRLIIEWYQSSSNARKRKASKIDFSLAIFLVILPIVITGYDYTKDMFVWKMPIIVSLIILGIGEFIAFTTAGAFSNLRYIRSKKEALKKGLPRMPVVVRGCFFYLPINILILVGLSIISRLFFNEPLLSKWPYLILLPFLIHIPSELYEVFGTSEGYNEKMKKIIEQHDARYQIGGWDSRAESDESELYKAADNGNINKVKELLELGGDPNEENTLGWTSFLISVANGHTNIVDLFIDYGADVNKPNILGRTAIMFASRYGFTNIVNKLIKNGAKININDNGKSGSPLSAASAEGHREIVELLLNNGADASMKDFDGKTALDYAQSNNHGEIARLLRKIKKSLDK